MTAEPGWLSAAELRAAYAAGDLSPREVCIAVLERAELLNPTLRAFLRFMGDSAMERARAAEVEWSRRRRRGETLEAPPLLGVPVSVKDTVDVAGAPTTMGSLLADGAPAAADELLVQRLRTSGAVLIGKTNTSEFGLAAQSFFEHHSALVLPTTATTAPVSRLRVAQPGGESVNPWLISTLHTPLANLIQAPAIAVPAGFDGERLPVSMQVVARPGDEATVLRCAAVIERALPWRDTRPAIVR